ncbi:TonB-dependent receptor [Hymenobacter sp.]|uniref:SusC/RagA family TonB-linked outer membrane protein n=1 Tax=Hymenobacter sp. TaxID=1898978 RepID=UPI002ED7922C
MLFVRLLSVKRILLEEVDIFYIIATLNKFLFTFTQTFATVLMHNRLCTKFFLSPQLFYMKKTVPKLSRVAIPALLCCLPLQVLTANAATLASENDTAADAFQSADISVSGRVTQENGEPLPGVTVLVKGTTTGASTNADGGFIISAPEGSTLVFSYVGYARKEVPVAAGSANMTVTLAEDVSALSEVVVVGYLSQDRQNLSSAVSSVDVREAAKAPVPTLVQSIQGRVAGVQVEGTGAPGSVPQINIRGVGSLALNSNPLYVIDGLWTNEIRNLSPSDIESTTVLKDASSTAVYGSRGANGVIIITTKRGQSGPPKISFNGYRGVESVYKTYDLTNHSQWADLSTVAYTNAGLQPLIGANKAAGTFTNNVDTDWQKELFQNGVIQDYNLNFSGGSRNGKDANNFLISGGYFNQEGIMRGPKFERYNLRLNSGLTRGRLKVSESLLLTHINTRLLNDVPFIDVLTMLPGIPVYNPTETSGSGFGYGSPALNTFATNPIGSQEILSRNQTNNLLQGSVSADLSIFDFLSYRLNLGLDMQLYADKNQRTRGLIRQNGGDSPASLFENRGNNSTLLVENTLNFNRSLGDNNINAVLGYSEQKYQADNASAAANNFSPLPQYYFVLGAGPGGYAVGGGINEWAKRSYFAQANYDYKNRYLVTGSFRRDGSSRFDQSKQYGNFYATSVGWRVSEEAFFKGALPFVNNLKLRASYGVNGYDELTGNYLYQATINQTVFYPLGSGPNQPLNPGSIQLALPSLGIQWEERYTTNFGIDAAFLENRLTLSTDYYISTTKKALVSPQLPAYLGAFGTDPFTNAGEIENKGLEFALGYHENRKAFTYGADLTLTTLKNEVKSLPQTLPFIAGYQQLTRTQVGQPISRLYLVPMEGIFQTEEEVRTHGSQAYASPGDVKYTDTNKDGQITDADAVLYGNPFPKVQYGLNLSAGFKGFDLSVFFQGVSGNDIFNVARFWQDRFNEPTNFRADLNPWSPTNPSTTTPRLLQAGGAGNLGTSALQNARYNSTRWVQDGSYFRMRNIQIGYTLPTSVTNKVSEGSTLRVYLTGRNVFTITDYTGYDPETPGPQTPGVGAFGRGIDDGTYPNVRAFTAGLQLNF